MGIRELYTQFLRKVIPAVSYDISSIFKKLYHPAVISVAETLYGSAKAVDPRSDYEDKAFPAVWHGHRSIIKDSMPVDDALFPMIYSMDTPDHRARRRANG